MIYTEYEACRNEFFIGKLTSAARKYGLELKLLLRERIALSLENGHAELVYEGKKQNDACFAVMRVNDFTLSFQLEKAVYEYSTEPKRRKYATISICPTSSQTPSESLRSIPF